MALNAAQQWWVSNAGSELNGGGYDSTISGAGTNYANQASAQLSLSDLACLNNTTLTSATGGFTSAMIGNVIRIASGTNFTAGYYAMTGYTDTHTVTIDRNPTTGANASSGVGKLGGSHADLRNYSVGGSAPAPAISSPLAPGHTVNIATGTYTQSGYYTFSSGNNSTGVIYFVGTGGPVFIVDLFMYNTSYVKVKGIYFSISGAGFSTMFLGCSPLTVQNCTMDQAGFDKGLSDGGNYVENVIINSGGKTAGTVPAILLNNGERAIGNIVTDCRGPALKTQSYTGTVINNIFSKSHSTTASVYMDSGGSGFGGTTFKGNTIYGGAADGIYVNNGNDALSLSIHSNIIYSNGGYGINCSFGDMFTRGTVDYNALGSNTSGAYNGITAGAHDVTLSGNPFTNATGGDFSLNNTAGAGAACRTAGWPNVFGASTTGYLDLGAVQHQDAGGGGGTTLNLYPVE